MVDRVQLTKYESTALGGQDADSLPYPAPLDPQEDAIETAGVYLQDASNRDETVLIDRNGDDMRFTDVNNAGGLTLSELVRSVSKVGTPSNNELAVWTGDGTVEGESELTYDGTVLTISGNLACTKAAVAGPITLTEVAAADGDVAGKGQVWVKDNTPNDLYFTDDTGVDHLVSLTESEYAKLIGRSGGQTLYGGTEAEQDLTLGSTASATRGHIYLGAAQASAYDETNDRLGIGTTAPDTVLHVHGATAGSVTALAGTVLTVENSTTAYLSFLTPNSATSGLLFGDPDDNDVGSIKYDHSGNTLSFTDGTTGTKTLAELAAAGGDVSVSGTPADNQVAVWTDATTIEGTTALTRTASALTFTGTGSFPMVHVITTDADDGGTVRLSTSGTSWDIYVQDPDLRFYDGADINVAFLASGKVGIGTTAVPHGAKGAAMLALDGTNASTAGPHVQFTTATASDYPLMQLMNWTHDNVAVNFDCSYDGIWTSSDAGSNYQIHKNSDKLAIRYDSGITAGSAITWNDGIVLDTSGQVGINNASPGSLLHVKGTAFPTIRVESTDSDGGTLRLISDGGYYELYVDGDADLCFHDGTATRVKFNTGGNVALGLTATPDSRLHVHEATAGTVAALANTIVTIENNTTAYLSFLTPNTATSGVLFGDPDDNDVGKITYDHATDTMSFTDGTTGTKTLAQVGGVALTGTPADNQVAVWTNATTIEGTSALTFTGTALTLSTATTYPMVHVTTTDADDGGVVRLSSNTTSWDIYVQEPDLLFYDGADINVAFLANGDVGIGVTAPDSRLHVLESSAGSVAAATGTVLTVENATATYLSFLTGNSVASGILFGDSDDNDVGGITYDHSSNTVTFTIAAASALTCTTSALTLSATTTYPMVHVTTTDADDGGTVRLSSNTTSWDIYVQDPDLRFYDGADINVSFLATGDVGIGVTSPDSRLHVLEASAGTVTALSGTVLTVENSTTAYISLLTPNTATSGILFGDPDDNDVGSIKYDHSSNVLSFTDGTTGTKTLAQLAAAASVTKVGTPADNQVAVWTGDGTIEGTSALTYDGTTLLLSSSAPKIKLTDSTTGGDSFIDADSGLGSLLFRADDNNEVASTNIAFFIDGSEKVRLTSGGDLGVGLTPTYRFEVEDSVASWTARFFNDGNSTSYYGIIVQCGLDDQSSGGTNYYFGARDGDGGAEGFLQVTNGTFELAQVSDESRKEDIQLSSLNATETLLNVPVHEYRRKRKKAGDPKAPKHRAGFVAQAMETAFPEMVSDGPDGLKAVAPTRLIPVLVKAVQELATEVAALKAR